MLWPLRRSPRHLRSLSLIQLACATRALQCALQCLCNGLLLGKEKRPLARTGFAPQPVAEARATLKRARSVGESPVAARASSSPSVTDPGRTEVTFIVSMWGCHSQHARRVWICVRSQRLSLPLVRMSLKQRSSPRPNFHPTEARALARGGMAPHLVFQVELGECVNELPLGRSLTCTCGAG